MGFLPLCFLLVFAHAWCDACTPCNGPPPFGFSKNFDTDKYWHMYLPLSMSYGVSAIACGTAGGFIPMMDGTKQMSLEVKADIRKI